MSRPVHFSTAMKSALYAKITADLETASKQGVSEGSARALQTKARLFQHVADGIDSTSPDTLHVAKSVLRFSDGDTYLSADERRQVREALG